MWRSSFLVNSQACRLIDGNFTIKWTPSQVFFHSILSPPMLPPFIDLSPSLHQILKSPTPCSPPPMFSTPVANPDKSTIQSCVKYCCHVWAGALKCCHYGEVFKPLFPVYPHRHWDSENMFCGKNLKMITTSLNSNFSIIFEYGEWTWFTVLSLFAVSAGDIL